MTRGVVARFDNSADQEIRAVWTALARAGIASLATHTHRLHAPHLSLVVAEALHDEAAALVLNDVAAPQEVRLEAAGYFPQGVLFLAAVPSRRLLELQRETFHRLGDGGAMTGPWPTSRPDAWSPHVTLAYGVPPILLGEAVSLVTSLLPLTCPISGLWVEDGETGEAWPMSSSG